jgi:Sec-independent protein secretion pathway component TatC
MSEVAKKEESSDEDELQSSSAPLLDHLTELRSRIIVSLVAIAAGFAVCFAFSIPIYEFLVVPFERAVGLSIIALYELSVFCVRLAEQKAKEAQEEVAA